MKKSIGVKDFLAMNFKSYAFEGDWLKSLGEPEMNFKALVFGYRKHGKTEFCMKLAKMLTRFGRVYYNSFEQGKSKSLQDSIKRNDLQEVAGKIVFGNRDSFDDMKVKIKNNKARFVIIDSRDYMELTIDQFKDLVHSFPRKSFIVICWEKGGKPAGEHAYGMSFIVDIIVHVQNFIAKPVSRFGGNEPYKIWNKTTSGQLTLNLN